MDTAVGRLLLSAFVPVEVLKKVHERKIQILAFANNHYAGYGRGTVEQFRELWRRRVTTEASGRAAEQGQLFK